MNPQVFNLVLFVHIVCFINVECGCRNFQRFSDNLRETVIGNCEVFQKTINDEIFCKEGFKNCTLAWEKFSTAFLYRPLCDVPDARYDEYVTLTDHTIPRDKALFWENVYLFAQRFSNEGRRYVPLAYTLTGYIGNGISWCSDPTNGMPPAGSLCPGWDETPNCTLSALRGFWIAASKRFAEKASGDIFIMLNASVVPIYTNDTYFSKFELPHLRRDMVTSATVLLVNESPVRDSSKCDDPSLQVLAGEMRSKSIPYTCVENRRDVVDSFCMQDPSHRLCLVSSTATFTSKPSITLSFLFALLFTYMF